MNTEVTTTKTFQERMYDKIVESMGDLMTPEDMRKLVDTALDKAFFTQKTVREGWNDVVKPSQFQEMVQAALKEEVAKAIYAWLDAHKDEVRQNVSDIVGRSMASHLTNYINAAAQVPLGNFWNELRNKGFPV